MRVHMIKAGSQPRPLPPLVEDLRRARVALQDARRASPPIAAREAQKHLADAIRAYADALAHRGLPVPYALRDELRVYSSLLAPHRHR
jgi:hypothetical protein